MTVIAVVAVVIVTMHIIIIMTIIITFISVNNISVNEQKRDESVIFWNMTPCSLLHINVAARWADIPRPFIGNGSGNTFPQQETRTQQ
jgi:hypothetical protein